MDDLATKVATRANAAAPWLLAFWAVAFLLVIVPIAMLVSRSRRRWAECTPAPPRRVGRRAGAPTDTGWVAGTFAHPLPMVAAMGRRRVIHRCTECGAGAAEVGGRCSACGAWNTLVEEVEEVVQRRRRVGGAGGDRSRADRHGRPRRVAAPSRPASTSSTACSAAGLVPGSVTLLGGEPGIGKSTLLLQLPRALARSRPLYVSAEESAQQVRLRAERLGAVRRRALAAGRDRPAAHRRGIDDVEPDARGHRLHPDRRRPDIGSAPGSVVQVRECAHRLVHEAKRRGIAVVLVGHVTKDGGLAGPAGARARGRHRALVRGRAPPRAAAAAGGEAPLRPHHRARPVRDERGRPGGRPRPEPPVPRRPPRRASPGSVVVPTMEGHRPLLVELQALVARSSLPQPRRSAQGLDPGRLSLLLAVLERRAGTSFAQLDVYASVVGGVRLAEPGADLAVCLASPSRPSTSRACRPISSCAARSASAASCARWPRPRAAWPRRPASGSGERSCRPRLRPTSQGSRSNGPAPWSRRSSAPSPALAPIRRADSRAPHRSIRRATGECSTEPGRRPAP